MKLASLKETWLHALEGRSILTWLILQSFVSDLYVCGGLVRGCDSALWYLRVFKEEALARGFRRIHWLHLGNKNRGQSPNGREGLKDWTAYFLTVARQRHWLQVCLHCQWSGSCTFEGGFPKSWGRAGPRREFQQESSVWSLHYFNPESICLATLAVASLYMCVGSLAYDRVKVRMSGPRMVSGIIRYFL